MFIDSGVDEKGARTRSEHSREALIWGGLDAHFAPAICRSPAHAPQITGPLRPRLEAQILDTLLLFPLIKLTLTEVGHSEYFPQLV